MVREVLKEIIQEAHVPTKVGMPSPQLPPRRSKTFQKGGLSATVEYTAEEMSFIQKRRGDYAKQGLAELFETDEYNDAQDNFIKQALIKQVFRNAGSAAYADLMGGGENPYSKSEQVNERFEQKATELFSNKILTLNQGKPVVGDYFEQQQVIN